MPSPEPTARILVWDLPLRVFHWLLAASFCGAFLTAESERWRDVHVMLGYTMLALVAFRVLWGIAGTRHARFANFAFGPRRVFGYLQSLATREPEHHTGHNPAGSWAIFALLACAVAAGGTGLALYNDLGGKRLEHLHEFFANTMLALVLLHLAGVLGGSLLHRENLAGAMWTGRKRGQPAEAIRTPRRVVAAALLAVVLGLWTGVIPAPGLATATAMIPVNADGKASTYTAYPD